MRGFLFAELAEFLQFQALGRVFFVLLGLIIQIMANRTFHVNQIVLRHKINKFNYFKINKFLDFPGRQENLL